MDFCIFDQIIEGKIPATKVWEDENFLAFLTTKPINPGHTLVIPKKHTEYIFDLSDQELAALIVACKPIAQAIKKAFNPKTGKVGVMVAGSGVPHAHIHLIPMDTETDLTFERAKDASAEELEENAKKIKANLSK